MTLESRFIKDIADIVNELKGFAGGADSEIEVAINDYIITAELASEISTLYHLVQPSINDMVTPLVDVHNAIFAEFKRYGSELLDLLQNIEEPNPNTVKAILSAGEKFLGAMENLYQTMKSITEIHLVERSLTLESIDDNVIESMADEFEKIDTYVRRVTQATSKFIPMLNRSTDDVRKHVNDAMTKKVMVESVVGDHFCVVKDDDIILGVGLTSAEALSDSQQWGVGGDDGAVVVACTKNVYDFVGQHGSPDEWAVINGIVAMPDEKEKLKESITAIKQRK